MENKSTLQSTLFPSSTLKVLDFLLQRPDQELTDTEIALNIKAVRKSAVNLALRKLADTNLITRNPRGNMMLNKLIESPLTIHLKITNNLIHIQPLVDKLIAFCSKIVLFGSRSDGTNISTSDYDLFVITTKDDETKKTVGKSELSENIQLISKHPEQALTLKKDEPVLNDQIKKGIILWEKK